MAQSCFGNWDTEDEASQRTCESNLESCKKDNEPTPKEDQSLQHCMTEKAMDRSLKAMKEDEERFKLFRRECIDSDDPTCEDVRNHNPDFTKGNR